MYKFDLEWSIPLKPTIQIVIWGSTLQKANLLFFVDETSPKFQPLSKILAINASFFNLHALLNLTKFCWFCPSNVLDLVYIFVYCWCLSSGSIFFCRNLIIASLLSWMPDGYSVVCADWCYTMKMADGPCPHWFCSLL